VKTLYPKLIFFCLALLPASPASAGEVNVSCAASLREAVSELAARFAGSNPAVRFTMNYGASGTLARQIESDAPADIFISANVEWMDHLKERKLVEASTIAAFTFNTLVFSGATPTRVSGMQDLVALERIAIGSPRSVPAGGYAAEAIKKAGLERRLANKVVLAKDARESLMYAERGEVDGAFVYRTDALLARRARILFTVPPHLYPRVLYPVALTAKGAKNRDAAAWYKYLLSGDAKRVLLRYGFALK